MSIIFDIVELFTSKSKVLPSLKLEVNSTMYRVDSEIRFITYLKDSSGTRKYELTSISSNKYLDKILKKVNLNSLTFADAIQILLIETGETQDNCNSYIYNLVTCGLLTTNLTPSTTGKDALEQIIDTISVLDDLDFDLNVLKKNKRKIRHELH